MATTIATGVRAGLRGHRWLHVIALPQAECCAIAEQEQGKAGRLLDRWFAENAAVERGAGGDVAHVLQQGAGREHGKPPLLGAFMVVRPC
nr:hypothetical protein [Stenotrophomonas maltophilia]